MSVPEQAIQVIPRNTQGWPRTKQQLDFALNVVQLAMKPHPAMLAAGYAKRTANQESHKLAAKLRPFLAFLQEKKNEQAAKHYEVTNTRILREMSAIGLQNVKDYITVVQINNLPRLIGKPVNELTDQQALAVESWEVVEMQGDDGPVMDYQYVLHNKMQGLVNLGRHLGMFSEKLMLDLNMRQAQSESIDFSAMPQDELELVIKTLTEIQDNARKARAIEGESHRVG